MGDDRPAIPAAMKRAVLEEAGYRCAIPACRAETTELAHTIEWSKVREHTFENLIALCPNCHTRYDKGAIPRKSIEQFKANLAVLNGRYGEFERRLIEIFSLDPRVQTIKLGGSGDALTIHLWYLLRDKMIERAAPPANQAQLIIGGVAQVSYFRLTDRGRELVERFKNAQPIG